MSTPGEVAAPSFTRGRVCSHDIPGHARTCLCGLRVAVVAGDWQLALFAWTREPGRLQPRLPLRVEDGVP